MSTKYTITLHDKPGSKARYRHALKLMGAESVRIEEASITGASCSTKPDTLPTSEAAKAVADLYGRKHGTPWADEEIAAFKAAVKTGLLTAETMMIVTSFYKTERQKPDHFCRTSLLTFCRHFGTELDKARAVKPRTGMALQWTGTPANVVPMLSPEEDERIRREALAGAAALKAKLRVSP